MLESVPTLAVWMEFRHIHLCCFRYLKSNRFNPQEKESFSCEICESLRSLLRISVREGSHGWPLLSASASAVQAFLRCRNWWPLNAESTASGVVRERFWQVICTEINTVELGGEVTDTPAYRIHLPCLTNVSRTEMDQPLSPDNKPNQGADFMELDGSSPSGHFEDCGAREMVLEPIPQVRQALEVINHACAISSTVHANKQQCKRLANRLSAIGEGFKSDLGWDKNFNGGNSSDDSDRNHYPALDELLTVLRKGEALVSSYADSKSISILVGRTDNRESFKEIHEELDTLKAQFDFESYSERGPVKDFEASSGDQRTQALTEDANLDLKTMPVDMAQIQDSEHRTKMDMEKVNEVVLEKSLVSDSSDELLNSIKIDLAAIKIGEPVRQVVLNSTQENADELGWAVVRLGNFMGIDYAVKVFKSAATDGAGWNNKQLLMEVGSLEKMRHPHIVKLVFFGQDAEQSVFLMELMDTDLRNFMNERLKPFPKPKPRPFKRPEELDIITQIAKAMLYMHTQQYAHGDLKCSNILVKKFDDHLDMKISDLRGSQKLGKVWDKEAFKQASRTRRPRWTAPEAIKLYDGLEPPSDLLKKSDVYSFGMTCYEVVTGGYPFDGIAREKVLEQVHAGQRPELPADLDEDLKGLIRQCWDPEPNKRPGFRQICYLLDIIRSKKPFVVSNKFSGQDMLLSIWKWIVPQGEEAISNDPPMGGGGIQRSNSALSVPEHLRIQRHDLKLVRPIGTGISATVYKATWLGCTFAAKVFTKSRFPDIQVLQTEVDFLVKLSRHPLIAMMVGLSVDENQQCSIVMELMDGNLRDLIKSRMQKRPRLLKREVGPFQLHEALSIIYKIALGMAFLHSKGVMHRDLKSGNVLVNEHAKGIDVKLVDFGLSIHEDESEGHNSGAGTAFWRAPEVFPKDADHWKKPDNVQKLDLKATDVYSFAMTCYEVLTGDYPCSDLGRKEYARVIDGYRPSLPAQLHPGLKALIEQCWHGNPAERPKFTEICEELKKIQEALRSSIFSLS